jgi:hypothetical protein
MANTKRGCEDFQTIEAAKAALEAQGFVRNLVDAAHYKNPNQMDDGYWQRADVWELPNLGKPFARVGYWPSIA